MLMYLNQYSSSILELVEKNEGIFIGSKLINHLILNHNILVKTTD